MSEAFAGSAAPKTPAVAAPKERGAVAAVTFADRGVIKVVGIDETAEAKAPTKTQAKAPEQGAKSGRERIELVVGERAMVAPEPKAEAKAKAKAKAPVAGKAVSGAKYGEIVARYAGTYGVPVALAHAVIRVESNYRADARGRAGEVGLMQIKPATARGLGFSGSVKALYHPETNIKYGMKYLGMAHKLGGGTTCGTILKYNAGHGAKRMNSISAAYCSKVKRHLGTA